MRKKITFIEVIIVIVVIVAVLKGYRFWNKPEEVLEVTPVPAEVVKAEITPIPTKVVKAEITPGEMVLIEGGVFKMGNNDGGEYEKPVHNVEVSSFYIGKYEVTNTEYVEFLNSQGNQKEFPHNNKLSYWIDTECTWGIKKEENTETFVIISGYESYPVTGITWYGAVAYCNWLSEKEGLEKCYGEKGDRWPVDITKKGYRLPTEAEWEYACRVGTTTKYYWGDKMDGDYCWYSNNSENKAQPVGHQKKANAFGLYNMNGNVSERCSDQFASYPDPPLPLLVNPTGPDSTKKGSLVICRGGSFLDDFPGSPRYYCTSSSRSLYHDYDQYGMIGFRLAKTP